MLIHIHIGVEEAMFKEIEKRRGKQSRSSFCRELILRALKEEG